jgi:class 3 adenylate cyclase
MAAMDVAQQQEFWASVKMRPVTLHWERNGEPLYALENGFIIQQTRASRNMLIVSTWLLLICQLGATAYDQTDESYSSGQLRIMLVIRLGIMTPTAALLIYFSYSRYFLDHARFVFAPAVLIVGACMVVYTSMQISSKKEKYTQPYGIYMMFMVYIFNYLPIRSCHALAVSFAVAAAFYVVLVVNEASMEVTISSVVILTSTVVVFGSLSYNREKRKRGVYRQQQVFQEISIGLLKEQQRNEDLLNSMLPASILTELNIRKTNGGIGSQSEGQGQSPMGIIAYSFDEVTVLFAKIDSFSTIANQLSPTELVKVLNTIYLHFDLLIDRHSVHKVETIGEVYMVVAGCPIKCQNHAVLAAKMGLEILVQMSIVRRILREQRRAEQERNTPVLAPPSPKAKANRHATTSLGHLGNSNRDHLRLVKQVSKGLMGGTKTASSRLGRQNSNRNTAENSPVAQSRSITHFRQQPKRIADAKSRSGSRRNSRNRVSPAVAGRSRSNSRDRSDAVAFNAMARTWSRGGSALLKTANTPTEDASAGARTTSQPVLSSAVEQLQISVGLHSGKIVAGVIGSSKPRFKLFGDTVNTASRMQSTSLPGRVQVSATTHEHLVNEIERSSLISRLSNIHKSNSNYGAKTEASGFSSSSYNTPEKGGRQWESGGSGAADDKEPDSPVTPLSAHSRGKIASKKLAAWNQQNVRISTLSSLRFEFEPRTPFKVKGKGVMQTYFVKSDDLTPIEPMTFIHDTMNSPSVHDGARAKDKIAQADQDRRKRIEQLSAGAGMNTNLADVGANFEFSADLNKPWEATLVAQLCGSGRGAQKRSSVSADGVQGSVPGSSSAPRRNSHKANIDMSQFERHGSGGVLRSQSVEFRSKHQQLLSNHTAPIASYTQLPALQIIWGLFGPACARRVLPLERGSQTEESSGSGAWALEAYFVSSMTRQWVFYVQQGCCIFILVICGLVTYDKVTGYDTEEFHFNALLVVRVGIVVPLCMLYIFCSVCCQSFFHHHVQIMSVLLLLSVGFMLILQVVWQTTPEAHDPNPYILGLFIVYEIESLRIVALIHRMWIGFVLALVFCFATASSIGNLSVGESMANLVILLIFWLGQLVPALLTEFADRSEFNHMKMVQERVRRLEAYDEQSESLLLSLLPATVIETLKNSPKQLIADYFNNVTILFTDIVQFTAFSSKLKPSEVVEFLNDMFSFFDDITEAHKAYKVEIIGDAYFLVSGCPIPCADHAATTARVGMEFLECLPQLQDVSGYDFGENALNIRIGIHSGPVMAGVVGMKDPRYHLFGSTVHLAEKMESTGEPGRVHLSHDTYELLQEFNKSTNTEERFDCGSPIPMEVKGHRGPMDTYFLERHVKPQPPSSGSSPAMLGKGLDDLGHDRDDSDSGSNKTNSFYDSKRGAANGAAMSNRISGVVLGGARKFLRTATAVGRISMSGRPLSGAGAGEMETQNEAEAAQAAVNVQRAAQSSPHAASCLEDSRTSRRNFGGGLSGLSEAATETGESNQPERSEPGKRREHWAQNLKQPGDEPAEVGAEEMERRRSIHEWEQEQTKRLQGDEWVRRGSGSKSFAGKQLEPLQPLPVSMVPPSASAANAMPPTQSDAGMVPTKKERRSTPSSVQREGSVEMGQMASADSTTCTESAALGHSTPRPVTETKLAEELPLDASAKPRPGGDQAGVQALVPRKSRATPKKSLKIARPPPPKALPPPH